MHFVRYVTVPSSISLPPSLYSPLDLSSFFSFLIPHIESRASLMGDQPVTRPLPKHRTTQTQNKHTLTSISRVGFEPTSPVFERAKTVHTLDSTAAEIDSSSLLHLVNLRGLCSEISAQPVGIHK
jgi:hypothetical protein